MHSLAGVPPDVVSLLRATTALVCDLSGARDGLRRDGDFSVFPYTARPDGRICQFDRSRSVIGFPKRPEDTR